ncbi:MAG TPA: hypothetical protein VH436_03165 [Vicinamibacterales bacterium]
MSTRDAAKNLGAKVSRRLQSAHKPIVRLMRRYARDQEQRGFRREAHDVDRRIAAVAAGGGLVIAGPWLAEVGYEVLYWIPFLRWFCDAHAVSRDRLIVISRGGMEGAYSDIASRYVDLFDLIAPEELAARNAVRRADHEGGGQKQSRASTLDEEIISAARTRLGIGAAEVCHPSLLFGLFRHVWHGNLPMDFFWRRTRYALMTGSARQPFPNVPDDFIAVKFYNGPALSVSDATRAAVRALVEQASTIAPVVCLDTNLGIDEHRDFDLRGLPRVTSADALMTARTNLGVQLSLIARSRFFLGTCGGLAWLAPFLRVPTVAVYDSDRFLATHLLIARQAGALAGAAEFSALDIRALAQLNARGTLAADHMM